MSSYAIVRASGKQHRVTPGERLKLNRIDGDVGAELVLDEVLLIGGEGAPRIGRPTLSGARVTATIVAQERGPKVLVFKRRKRKGFHKMIGHRQELTEVQITGIAG